MVKGLYIYFIQRLRKIVRSMGRFHEKKLLFLWILSILPLLMKCIYCRNAGCVISRATPYQSRIKVQLNSSNAKDKRSILLDEFWEHFNWNWEDDGRILLSRDSRKRLQVPVENMSNTSQRDLNMRSSNFIKQSRPQLQGSRRLRDDIWSFLQSSRRLLFSFGGDHLKISVNWSDEI